MAVNSKQSWDAEYTNPTFITGSLQPTYSFIRFVEWYKKKLAPVQWQELSVIDFGCGNGRHAAYLAKLGATCTAFDSSSICIQQGNDAFNEPLLTLVEGDVSYLQTIASDSIHLALDVTSSHCLTSTERKIFITELHRILAPKGILYSRILAAENKHSQKLCILSPGTEPGSYILPNTSIQERPLLQTEILAELTEFTKLKMTSEVGYTRVGAQKIRRNYWESIWQKQ